METISHTFHFSHWFKFEVPIQRFSNDCRKTITKAITLTNHNRSKQRDEPIRIIVISSKFLKARENHAYNVQLVSGLLLIG